MSEEQRMILVPGVFDGDNEFFIRSGQHHESPHVKSYGKVAQRLIVVAKDSYWTNQRCQKLGYGDLIAGEIQRISRNISGDELFIVMDESCNHGFQRTPQEKEGICDVSFVFEHMILLIGKNLILQFSSFKNRATIGNHVDKRLLHGAVYGNRFCPQKIFKIIQ